MVLQLAAGKAMARVVRLSGLDHGGRGWEDWEDWEGVGEVMGGAGGDGDGMIPGLQ